MLKFYLTKFRQIPRSLVFKKMENKTGFNSDIFTMLENHRFTKGPKKVVVEEKKPIVIKYEEKKEPEVIKEPEKPKFDPDMKKNFEYIYEKITEMRKDRNAPVDTMGCMANADQTAPKETRDFQLLVSLILSVQTKDEKTAEAMKNLKEKGLTLENMYKMSEEEIYKLIKCVNFNNNKAKYLKNLATTLVEKYDSKIPEKVEELIKFPGIGYKIAVLFVNHAFEHGYGIGVDTHVHRICNRLGLAKTKTPDQTRVELESYVDKKYWHELNLLLVGFGQQICQPVRPKCEECLLNNLCPEGIRNTKEIKGVTKKTKTSTAKSDTSEERIKIPSQISTQASPEKEEHLFEINTISPNESPSKELSQSQTSDGKVNNNKN